MDTYGNFSQDGREFVITRQDTPRPWHNYLVNDHYLVNLTQHATGASFWHTTGEGLRVNLTEDKDGSGGPRYLYLKDNDSGDIWSVSGAPFFIPMEDWKCRVGLGYQINESTHKGIQASWRIFVPNNGSRQEIWTLTLKNVSGRPRNISAVPYLEMHLTGGSTLMDFISVLGGRFEQDCHAVFGINSCVKFPDDFKAFLAADRAPEAVTVSRDEFLGHYRSYLNPKALEEDVHNPEAGTEWLGASLKHSFSLEPEEEVVIHYTIGVCASVEEGKAAIRSALTEGTPEALFQQLQDNTAQQLSLQNVQTPDPQFNRWVNVWLNHQLAFVARWGRVIGRGFRDILQDTFGHRITDPAKARECILEVFSKQFPDGRCIRAWRLPTAQLDLQHYADSPSWMIMALSQYLKETGDFAVLEEAVPYLNPENPYAEPTSSGTVWEHVLLAQRHLLEHRGSHGLSKIYYGDWCDTMNGVGKAGKGESVMLSMQVRWGCDLLAELATQIGKPDIATEMEGASEALKKAILDHCWDGEWFVRAFDDEGIPVGSHNPPESDNGEGKIFLNAQSWSVISDVASVEQKDQALAAAEKYLNVGYGMVLNWPAFTGLKPRIGQMTAMTPGFYENASVYVHGNCFWIYALAVAGRGDESWKALQAILPDTPNKANTDTEAFIVPNYYIGPNVDRRKQRNLYLSGWRTGSASWLYVTALEWIMGLRAEYAGLKIDPRLPDGWKDASANRFLRGNMYRVTFSRPSGKGSTIQKITVDGTEVKGNLIPWAEGKGKTIEIEVVMA